jgi:hypothetical protein
MLRRASLLPTLALATLLCAGSVWVSAQRSRPESAMYDAAKAFLATLNAEQKGKVAYPFNSEERLNWFFTPVPRKGLPLKEMSASQQKAALDLLRAGLSEKGYSKAETIRKLEEVLRELEKDTVGRRDPEKYFFTVFGDPAAEGTWGWRYEGHHCSQNWTIVKGKALATSPQFFGSNPGEVRAGPMKGTRVLHAEEDLARALVKSLNDSQKAEAVVSATAPNDILTSNKREVGMLENNGLAYGKMNKEQQGLLLQLIEEYASAQHRAIARQRVERIRGEGLDNVKFAWMGDLEKGKPHYYRIQGKSFLIEYDNVQNEANHVHCVWREFKGDWGMDLLAQHYRTSPHHAASRPHEHAETAAHEHGHSHAHGHAHEHPHAGE